MTFPSGGVDEPAGAPREPLTVPGPPRMVRLTARPESVEIDLARTAVVVVDMQNAFMSDGGMFDRSSLPIEGAKAVIEPSRRLLDGVRAGGPGSPNWYKETGIQLMRRTGEWGEFITEGTWDERIIDELTPQSGDVVVRKQRYSGFAGTSLDHVLKTLGTRYLLFIGGATNVCVWTTLADAFFLDYWPVLVEDACFSQCPPVTVEGTLWNVENLFGWVSSVEDVLAAVD